MRLQQAVLGIVDYAARQGKILLAAPCFCCDCLILLHGLDCALDLDGTDDRTLQAFGAASRKRLAAFVAGKDITVEWSEKDRYGRILGTVFEGGRDVNLEMVKDGMAWHYKRYDNTEEYADAEAEARRERRGLWRDANPTPPWEFRKSRRK